MKIWKCKYCRGTVGAKIYQIEELDKKGEFTVNNLNHFNVESYQCSKCGEYSEELENVADWMEAKE